MVQVKISSDMVHIYGVFPFLSLGDGMLATDWLSFSDYRDPDSHCQGGHEARAQSCGGGSRCHAALFGSAAGTGAGNTPILTLFRFFLTMRSRCSEYFASLRDSAVK